MYTQVEQLGPVPGRKAEFKHLKMSGEDCDVGPAVQLGSQLIETILSSGPSDLPIIHSLIKAGAPLWYQEDVGGLSALHAACFVEHPEMVRMLIENGAVWNSGKHPP